MVRVTSEPIRGEPWFSRAAKFIKCHFSFSSWRLKLAQNPINIGDLQCGADHPLLLIAGPCVIESESLTLEIAEKLVRICDEQKTPLIFKASFDKANRTSLKSYRGVGITAGLQVLAKVRQEFDVPVTTDVHLPEQAKMVAEVCQLLQIPAFLARQTDLLVAAGETGLPVNVKKGQFMAPLDMQHVVGKLNGAGCENVCLTERGTFFGYGSLVNDMTSIPKMQSLGVPVVFDATHSVQQINPADGKTGGNRALVAPLARAAVAMGCDGVFMETHVDPDQSPSDAANMIPLDQVPEVLKSLNNIRKAIEF